MVVTNGQIAVFAVLGVLALVVIIVLIKHLISEWRKVKFVQPRNGPTKPPYSEVSEIMSRDQFMKLQNEKRQNKGRDTITESNGHLAQTPVTNGTVKKNAPKPKRNRTFQQRQTPTQIKQPLAADHNRSSVVTARDIHAITEV